MFDSLSQKISNLFSRIKGNSFSSQEAQKMCSSMKDILIDADVPLHVARNFSQDLEKDIAGISSVKGAKVEDQVVLVTYKKIVSFLGENAANQTLIQAVPSVIMIVGVQGSGKTTTAAKLGYYLKKQIIGSKKNLRVLVASVDFYRPAAIEQLAVMAQKAGIDFYRARTVEPVEATKEIYAHFKAERYDILIFDTAGRLHVDEQMLEEASKIKKVLSPACTILVLDAMTGQESLAIAKSFDAAVPFDGAILTKMDSDARGGAAFSFRYVIGKPIFFVGYGEKVEDLQLFYPRRIAQRMIGMGDLETLSERVESLQKPNDKEKEKRFLEGEFTFDDFLQQVEMMNKLGSFSQFAKYIPGVGSLSGDDIARMELQLKKQKAIIASMTPKERCNQVILNESRKKRIASGAGVDLKEVDGLLKYFEELRRYAKMMKKQGFLRRLFQ